MEPRAIVVTTINAPTPALKEVVARYASTWRILIVGDNRTPEGWELDGTEFFDIVSQRSSEFRLAALLPENHYSRKNLGYLLAMRGGAEAIAETDDDNRPYCWNIEDSSRDLESVLLSTPGWTNVYRYFTEDKIWPRGFPLERVLDTVGVESGVPGTYRAIVQQSLAAGDPDVDAIYRMVVGKANHEYRLGSVVLGEGVISPFNSQSTLWYAEAFPLMYLPSFVSFRMTDIWRSFVAQVCLWAMGERLSYSSHAVWQDRNAHDLRRDFADEVVGYERNDEIMTSLMELSLTGRPIHDLSLCYEHLNSIGIVESRELNLVDAWLGDLRAILVSR